MVKELEEINTDLKLAEANRDKYTEYEEILGVQDAASYETLFDAREELNLRYDMWKGIKDFGNLTNEWQLIPFAEIDAKKIEQ